MNTKLTDTVEYRLSDGEQELYLNDLIGKSIVFEFTGEIRCISCDKSLKKTYGQGYCWDCFQEVPEASPCIIRPELCEAHLGRGRDPQWEKEHHFTEHVVYLALSSAVKVGVTRQTQVPTRWIDQGAHEALVVCQTPYRQLAGEIEVSLKEHFTDKTNWQRMLKDQRVDADLKEEKEGVLSYLPGNLQEYFLESSHAVHIQYPVIEYPQKVKSINLLKTDTIEGKLMGIKGQYLIFDENRVINIRNHSGFFVEISH
jgi:hypothetical protein